MIIEYNDNERIYDMGMLDGKTALITGGGTGIGKAIARRFYDEGAAVVLSGRREKMLIDAVNELSSSDGRVDYITADVTADDECRKLIETTVERKGGLHILVNNAGVMRFGGLHETPLEEWGFDDAHECIRPLAAYGACCTAHA